MVEDFFILRFLIYSILGHYISRLASSKKSFFYGPISPLYGLFSLLVLSESSNIIVLFLSGIIWGMAIDFFAKTVDRDLSMAIRPPLYGLLNIVNFYILEGAIMNIITLSTPMSKMFLLIFGIAFFLFDISFSLRKSL